ncbi:hypothetical protein JCM16303_003537 [Sporobolomyces ruberrimus]
MESPFDTPTVRPSDPINDALKADFDRPGTARSTNLRVSSPPSLRPPMSPPTSSYDNTTSRNGSRMAQARPSPAASLSPKSKSNSLYPNAPSSSAFAKNPKKQSKRLVNDRSKRSSWNAETQSVMSQQSRQPQAQDFQEPSSEELVRFAALSRRQYYDGDKEAARKVGEILAKLPPASVAIYSRTMAGIRSEYHRDKEIERRVHVETTLASILPGSKIKQALGVSLEDGLGGGLAAMRSSKARKARREAFKAFLDTNCVKAVPGCHPFFRSLYAALWLQSIEPGRGGAGARRVEWEVDVAVFTEAGGGVAWTREAVEALKGVLGMSERIKEPLHTDTFRSSMRSELSDLLAGDKSVPCVLDPSLTTPDSDEDQLDAQSAPEEQCMLEKEGDAKKSPPVVPPHRSSLRDRSPSDPFCDPGDRPTKASTAPALPPRESPGSPRMEFTSPDLASTTSSTPFLSSVDPPSPGPTSPVSPKPARPPLLPSRSSHSPPAVEPQFRIFTLPTYLTNPELRALCRMFPDFIATPARTGARFRSTSVSSMDRTKAQKDAGVNEGSGGGGPTRVGHGELRIGSGERDPGWRGTLWERIIAWFKALFG